MMGFDRPLKAEWIYKTLKMIEPGKKPSDYYQAFDKTIAVERTGKDGTRKIRTVLFRTFVYSFQDHKSTIENNLLIELCKAHDIRFMKPLFLAKLTMDYEILWFQTQKIQQLFDPCQELSSSLISKQMVAQFGDTEIVKRSTRSFFKTLSSFGILEPVSMTRYHQIPKTALSREQVKFILKLYADINHTRQIDIKNFDKFIFGYYQQPVLSKVALAFHNQEWEYIRDMNRELLLLK
ncbi:hypothetical protein QUF80_11425 [Desulfococcaceae bacterium HSG8]|nr:hypothetical protein [Desulfococcaceae bacterium HSG8]